jgi:hypothetical protein
MRRQLRHGAEGWVPRLAAIRRESKTVMLSGEFLLQAGALAAASVRARPSCSFFGRHGAQNL